MFIIEPAYVHLDVEKLFTCNKQILRRTSYDVQHVLKQCNVNKVLSILIVISIPRKLLYVFFRVVKGLGQSGKTEEFGHIERHDTYKANISRGYSLASCNPLCR